MKTILTIFTALLVVAGLVLGFYINIMWLVNTIVDIINHVKQPQINSYDVAWDIVRILFRSVVFFVVMLACQIPAFISGVITASMKD